jgi:hypothetical protein
VIDWVSAAEALPHRSDAIAALKIVILTSALGVRNGAEPQQKSPSQSKLGLRGHRHLHSTHKINK